jgi:4-hydroxybenzoate polyprenyltransferase
MTLGVALKLGRVSNLPTVWTNALAGMVLADGFLDPGPLFLLLLAVSLAYVAGMFLNDAFDAEVDAKERPERPIPAGEVGRNTIFLTGFAMLAASVVGLGYIGRWTGTGPWPAGAGLALAAAILFYDWRHKQNPFGPLIMGLCRVLVYVAAALCVTTAPSSALWSGAVLTLCHLIGLTYVAKREARGGSQDFWPSALLLVPFAYGIAIVLREPVALVFWLALAGGLYVAFRAIRRRDVGFAVITMIAAISLLDAMLIAGQARFGLAVLAALGFPLTLALQRFVRGT